ncbi:hypothetical protein [Paenibacillus fonticola]|nr:hypothetical protein [Paenibacillus fonticola]
MKKDSEEMESFLKASCFGGAKLVDAFMTEFLSLMNLYHAGKRERQRS